MANMFEHMVIYFLLFDLFLLRNFSSTRKISNQNQVLSLHICVDSINVSLFHGVQTISDISSIRALKIYRGSEQTIFHGRAN